jgi:glutamate/tyrosine decarboxylase-like PLP-dependent enzyme
MDLLNDAARRAHNYLNSIHDRRVSPAPESITALEAAIKTELPANPTPPETVLEEIDQHGSPATVATQGGRFFGFVTGGTTPAALAASWMVSAWDQNAALRVMSPAAAIFEETALTWLRDLLNLPEQSAGAIVTGATMANFTGLAAARHALLKKQNWDVENDGLFGAPPITVVVGGEVHVSLLKALGMLGLGRRRVLRVPVDGQGRMRADALPPLNENTIACIQAGNVNTGAFDPANEICAIAHQAGAWVHVDGAFGLFAAMSPHYRHLTNGFEQADSWATDGHKWPNVGYDCGLAFVRDAEALRAAMTMNAAYLPPGAHRDPCHYTPEMSRRARGVELWAAIRAQGRTGMAALIERTCSHARRFADALRAAGHTVLNDVVLNQVLVSFGTPEQTLTVMRRIQAEGVCWCGETQWQGHVAMRISVSSWATTEADVDAALASILRATKT